MKKLFFVYLAIISSLSSLCAQSEEVIIAYFDKDLTQVSDPAAAAYYRTAERKKPGYIVRDYTTGKTLLLHAECSAYTPELIVNGKVTEYYENGKLKAEGVYKDNNPIGMFRYFHSSGTPKGRQEYTEAGIRYLESFSETGEELIINGKGLFSQQMDNAILYTEVEDYKSVAIFTVDNANDTLYTQTDTPGEYKGGYEQMMRVISKNIHFPVSARINRLEGIVSVSLIIPKTGPIEDVWLASGFSEDCDAEAVRVVRLLKDWTPAKHKGKIVKSIFTLPIKFKVGQ